MQKGTPVRLKTPQEIYINGVRTGEIPKETLGIVEDSHYDQVLGLVIAVNFPTYGVHNIRVAKLAISTNF